MRRCLYINKIQQWLGLGNIAGVAIAIQLGSPDAVFRMTLAGFFGMTSKFTECTLAQLCEKLSPLQRLVVALSAYSFKELGVLFSPEAGIGSDPIAHSAARTEEPIREGIVALLEPFIDTIVICNMTALVIVSTGAYRNNLPDGVQLTFAAFRSDIPWFPYILGLAVFLFAFSTIISWGYYGERAWAYLFGERSLRVFQVIYVVFVFFGAVVNLESVLNLGDIMLLCMAFPNLLGCYILSGKVAAALADYQRRLADAKMPAYR